MTETHKAAVEALKRWLNGKQISNFALAKHIETVLEAIKQPSSVEVTERFFIDTDNSGNKFLIPFDKKSEWEEYLTIPEDDERSWDVPDFAYPLEGEIVVFSDPRIKGFPVGRITRAAATDGVNS